MKLFVDSNWETDFMCTVRKRCQSDISQNPSSLLCLLYNLLETKKIDWIVNKIWFYFFQSLFRNETEHKKKVFFT